MLHPSGVLTGLTKSWAIELAPYKSGCFHSSNRRKYADERWPRGIEGLTPKEVAERSAGNLINVPWVEAEDVANAVVFLVSDNPGSLPVHSLS
jgi:NAD(P)-dependent dehydrogenase (short-subunit alcohol dehydrogenase family)